MTWVWWTVASVVVGGFALVVHMAREGHRIIRNHEDDVS